MFKISKSRFMIYLLFTYSLYWVRNTHNLNKIYSIIQLLMVAIKHGIKNKTKHGFLHNVY